MIEYTVPVFYHVKAESVEQAREAVICTLESHEYDQSEDEPGYFAAVCVGNLEEITSHAPTPKDVIGQCPQCGEYRPWIERYQSLTNYNLINVDFTDEGQVDTFEEIVGKPQWDTAETIELRCYCCLTPLTDEQVATVEAMFS